MHPHYFDHNATTPLCPAAREAMLPWIGEQFGNSASRHRFGRAAHAAVETARQQIAAAVNADVSEVILVSGGSEADNFALHSTHWASHERSSLATSSCLLIGAIEHSAVLEPANELVKTGRVNALVRIGVGGDGRYRLSDVETALDQLPEGGDRPYGLAAMMLANNETGAIQPVAELAAALKARWPRRGRLAIHTDAVQALGKIVIDFRALNAAGVSSLALSAHKINGPQGIGALVVDKRLPLKPLVKGGGHEQGRRAGTLNVAAIVGFGAAAAALSDVATRQNALAQHKNRFEAHLKTLGATLFAEQAPRLAGTSYFAFPDIDGETLVGMLDEQGFLLSSGAACSSIHNVDQSEASHVLLAMGVPPQLARCAVRASFGDGNDASAIDELANALASTTARCRAMLTRSAA